MPEAVLLTVSPLLSPPHPPYPNGAMAPSPEALQEALMTVRSMPVDMAVVALIRKDINTSQDPKLAALSAVAMKLDALSLVKEKVEAMISDRDLQATVDDRIDDDKDLESEAVAAEQDAQSAYEEFISDSNKSIAAKSKVIAEKTAEMGTQDEALVTAKGDMKVTMVGTTREVPLYAMKLGDEELQREEIMKKQTRAGGGIPAAAPDHHTVHHHSPDGPHQTPPQQPQFQPRPLASFAPAGGRLDVPTARHPVGPPPTGPPPPTPPNLAAITIAGGMGSEAGEPRQTAPDEHPPAPAGAPGGDEAAAQQASRLAADNKAAAQKVVSDWLAENRLSRLAATSMGRTRLSRGRLDLLEEDHDDEEAAIRCAEALTLEGFYGPPMDDQELYMD